MNQSEQPKISKRMLIWTILYAILFFAIILISNLKAVNLWLSGLLTILRPVLIGLVIAYLCNPFFRFFERKLLFHVRPPKLRRVLSLLLTYLLLLLIIAGLLLLLIPQLISSVQNFIQNFDSSLSSMVDQLNSLLSSLNAKLPARNDGTPAISLLNAENIRMRIAELGDVIMKELENSLKPENLKFVKDFLNQTTSLLTMLVFAFFVSLYLLASKEKRYAQIMKFRKAYFSERVNARLTHILTVADRSFGGFLRGKILDSTIVGILVYLTCLIFQIPYAVLVAVVVGITDIIPVIGPFLGVIPTAIIILLTDPIKVIIFLISILVIQQIDGNIIAPKILGENTGVSSLCVLIAIIVMGNLWGLVGMLVGVPLFATVIELIKWYLEKRLQEKKLAEETDSIPQGTLPEQLEASGDSPSDPNEQKKTAVLQGGAGNLTQTEHIQLRIYALAKKYRVFHDMTDQTMTDFAAEAAEVFAAVKETEPDRDPLTAPVQEAEPGMEADSNGGACR